ncbi:MAG TPA: fibronectin type III domain-containing protein [Solirubrobacterales bacterium]|nr:fibronectin type III domain-containing protein [Solirubrobacterales bacterium]
MSTASALSYGLMWSETPTAEKSEGGNGHAGAEMEMVNRSGSSMFRMNIAEEPKQDEAAFRAAAEHHITIVPVLYQGSVGYRSKSYEEGKWYARWEAYVKETVHLYGYNGSFWKTERENHGLEERPVTAWEVWNEPNLDINSPAHLPDPPVYGELLVNTKSYIDAAENENATGHEPEILFGGLFAEANSEAMSAKEFLIDVFYYYPEIASDFNGLSFHPYAFRHEAGEAIERISARVEGHITEVRETLSSLKNAGSKPIWITELGWPYKTPKEIEILPPEQQLLYFNEYEQELLLLETFKWVKENAVGKNIATLFWYNNHNITPPISPEWASFCGLKENYSELENGQQQGLFRTGTWAGFKEITEKTETWPKAPSVETTAEKNGSRTVTLKGTVNPYGLPTSYWFEWGTKETELTHTAPTPKRGYAGWKEGATAVSATIEVTPVTTYYYRLRAQNEDAQPAGEGGPVLSFTSLPDPPVVTLEEPLVVAGKITLHGTVTPEQKPATYRFEWGTTKSYGSKAEGELPSGTSPDPVKTEITSFKANTLYYYRLVAENGAESPGEQTGTFTSKAAVPIVTTEGATEVVEREATLNGTVNPEGAVTKYYFEYGTTESYGSKSATGELPSGTTPQSIHTTISGLNGETTYHYRLVAENEAGQTKGKEDKTFKTTNGKAIVTTEGGTFTPSLEPTVEGTLKGKVDPDANATTYYFEYGLTTSYGSKAPVPSGEAGSGKLSKSVEAKISGLRHRTTYYYRLVAENAKGTTDGAQETLSTKQIPEWAIESPVNPLLGKPAKLAAVSCTSSTECMAVGEAQNSSGVYQSLAEHWKKSSGWEVKTMESGSSTVSLDGIACNSATGTCEAVGYYFNGSVNEPLVEYWNGSTWKPQESSGQGLGGALTGVSCTSASECTAVGYYKSSLSETKTLALRWNGSKWEKQTTPSGMGATVTKLTDVSCENYLLLGVLHKECIASGYLEVPALSIDEAVAERWNGTEWTLKTIPKPEEGAKASYLLGVSCATSTECEAVGYYKNSSSVNIAMAEKWSGYYGTSWSAQSARNREGAKLTKLAGVSCLQVEKLECEAVGEFETSLEKHRTLTEKSNGTSWEIQYTPNANEEEGPSYLGGVSCTGGSACTSVGYSEKSSVAVTLAERFE